jgi:hypothetical protein
MGGSQEVLGLYGPAQNAVYTVWGAEDRRDHRQGNIARQSLPQQVLIEFDIKEVCSLSSIYTLFRLVDWSMVHHSLY